MTSQPLAPLSFEPPRALHAAPWPAAALLVATCAIALVGRQAAWLILVAPLLEEIVFRGGLQSALLRHVDANDAAGLMRANALTALAFGAAHLLTRPSWLAAATVLPALVIGWAYQRHRSVAVCVGLHALFNAIWLGSASITA